MYCTQCGYSNRKDVVYCTQCGNKYLYSNEETNSENNNIDSNNSDDKRSIIFVSIAVSVLFISLCIILFSGDGKGYGLNKSEQNINLDKALHNTIYNIDDGVYVGTIKFIINNRNDTCGRYIENIKKREGGNDIIVKGDFCYSDNDYSITLNGDNSSSLIIWNIDSINQSEGSYFIKSNNTLLYEGTNIKSLNESINVKDEVFKMFSIHTETMPKGVVVDEHEITIGDLNNDGMEDAVVDYNLVPDGGNAILGFEMLVYINEGSYMKEVAKFKPDYMFDVIEVKYNEIDILKHYYKDDDYYRYPTGEKHINLKLKNGKIVGG